MGKILKRKKTHKAKKKKAAASQSLKAAASKTLDKQLEVDTWATTEEALTRDLEEDLRDAWLKIRDLGSALGPQRIYASGKAIMFSKRVCYFFVRPKKKYLEVVVFLKDPNLRASFRSVKPVSKLRSAHTARIIHSDEVEGDFVEALSEAYGETPD